MKIKNISTLIAKGIILISFIHAGSISPTLGLRFNDVSGSTDLIEPVQAIGLQLSVGEGIYSGVETDGTDFRLYVKQSFGSFSMGTDVNGDPQFGIGGHYSVMDNFTVSLDYMINRLTDADAGGVGTDPFPDQLRMSLSVSF
jgi:hypothetical protein